MAEQTPTTALGFDNFFQASLTGDITASSTDILLDAIPTASEGFLVIEPDSTTAREIIYYNSKTALKVVCPSADARGQGGTTAGAHSTGATVIMAPIAEMFEALQNGYAINAKALKFNTPQGYLQNGVITRSVSSNNITVAIKTLAGNDPSASDPVIVRIGDSIRTITSALSVTKNAGTNWFSSGSSDLATGEIDYFVYLGYNATDGVTIGFARIPHANTYGDFNTTSTNARYCAISTITNATSTDQYENVGRFNATLSATASFNWSVPATSIVINRPIFDTRWLNVATPTVNNISTSSKYLRYKISHNHVDICGAFTASGAGSGVYSFNLPISAASSTGISYWGSAYANDVGTTYHGGVANIGGGGSTVAFFSGGSSTANWFTTAPFTWGNTDNMSFTARYEI